MIPETERKSADVLVLGGGMAGCMGAVAAAMAGRSVILVDKAWVGGSGESCFAAGDILYFDPEEDDIHEWLERWNKNGNGMFDPEWMEWYAHSSTEIINMMNEWGMDFEKDANGKFKRKPGRGHNHAVVFPGFKMMKKLRIRLEKLGVTIIDRVQVTDLLTNDGQVVGATGFNIRTGQFYIFNAKNTNSNENLNNKSSDLKEISSHSKNKEISNSKEKLTETRVMVINTDKVAKVKLILRTLEAKLRAKKRFCFLYLIFLCFKQMFRIKSEMEKVTP